MTPEEFRERLHMAPLMNAYTGDSDLNPIGWHFDKTSLKPAAVLVPIIIRTFGLSVLFTQRSHTLSSHPGQVSFPGGKIDVTDTSNSAAALREAWEEVGIPSRSVDIIYALPTYHTGSGFQIEPVVGLVTPDFEFVLQTSEVESIFELPLLELLNPDSHKVESREWQNMIVNYYVIEIEKHRIWGATAGMLVSLSRTLGMRK
jgi:8-oxo-dGTP pyrophosphatase MutT (NUDIX family)